MRELGPEQGQGRLGAPRWTSGVEAWGAQGWSSTWVTVKVRGGVVGWSHVLEGSIFS